MANWKTHTITSIDNSSSYKIKFGLAEWIVYSDGYHYHLNCANEYPFNTYRVGDKIEIDSLNFSLRAGSEGRMISGVFLSGVVYNHHGIVKKLGESSTAIVPSSSSSTGMVVPSKINH